MELNRAATIPKPRKIAVTLASGRAWSGGGFLYLRKYDGCWHPGGLAFNGHVLIVERMRPDAAHTAPWFAAHSVASIAGQNVLNEPTRARWRDLCLMAMDFPAHVELAECGHGGEFVQTVIEAGGEGVCAFDLDAPWGEMWVCKRIWEGVCMVTGFCGGTQSVTIADPATGQARGRVALRGGKCDQVQLGSMIKVQGVNLTAAGQVREPRLCRDAPGSWLVSW